MRPGVRSPRRPPDFLSCLASGRLNARFRYASAFRMRRIFHSRPALRGFCLFSFAALSLLAGCGGKLIGESQTPAAPANPHSVTINWTVSKSPVAGYNVYRASPPGAPIKLTVRIVSETQYTDRTVEAGHTYSYAVTAVDFKGRESKPSANITVSVPTTTPPPAKQ
jgi:hypothetical protein